MSENRLRAAAYCRVSTSSDLQDGSFETQCSYYETFIRAQPGLEFAGIYADHGKSGREIRKRPEFRRLIKDCEDGKIDIIYTKSLSRFARNMAECVETTRHLRDLGIRILFEKEGLDTMSSTSELLLGILATIAQEESNSISRNIQWSRQKHLERGQPWEKPRYGYRSIGKSHEWQVIPSQAAVVRKAFYLAGMCHTFEEIRQELNQMEQNAGSDRIWNQTPIINLLRSSTYLGDYLSHQKISIIDANGRPKRVKNRGQVSQFLIKEHHTPLISQELYDIVQELLDSGLLRTRRTSFSPEDIALMKRAMAVAAREPPLSGQSHQDNPKLPLKEMKFLT